mmetsp:Transcript_1890/g.4814  ORF Transcript_1890/g.4814 Transcript_1890/m.4814 type:complete len:226 (-) Transcript_1890:1218-1895(-)
MFPPYPLPEVNCIRLPDPPCIWSSKFEPPPAAFMCPLPPTLSKALPPVLPCFISPRNTSKPKGSASASAWRSYSTGAERGPALTSAPLKPRSGLNLSVRTARSAALSSSSGASFLGRYNPPAALRSANRALSYTPYSSSAPNPVPRPASWLNKRWSYCTSPVLTAAIPRATFSDTSRSLSLVSLLFLPGCASRDSKRRSRSLSRRLSSLISSRFRRSSRSSAVSW